MIDFYAGESAFAPTTAERATVDGVDELGDEEIGDDDDDAFVPMEESFLDGINNCRDSKSATNKHSTLTSLGIFMLFRLVVN